MRNYLSFVRVSLVVTLLVALLLSFPPVPGLASSGGPNNAGVGENISGVGSEAWLNPGNITTPGSPYATVSLYHLHTDSNYLRGTRYGFSIPTDAYILGIELAITRQSSGHSPSVIDNVVSLVKAGAIVGDNKASITPWSTDLITVTYGSSTDLWGTTWSPLEVNSDNFGAVVAASRDNNGNKDRQAIVDTMKITVYYAYNAETTVDCGNGSPITTYGETITCVATVTCQGSNLTPTGTVDWSTDGSGTFDPNPCTLLGADGTATCSALYTPTQVGSSYHLVTARYSGDELFTPSSNSETVIVNQRPITVSVDPKTKVYGEDDPMLTFQITAGTLVYSDTFTGTLTRDPGEDVGSYAILQGTLALSPNYDLTYVGDNLAITPRPVTITADAKTKVYGELDPELTYQITAGTLVYSDTFTGTLTREVGEDVGSYAIQQGTVALSPNYDLTYIEDDLAITPRPITVTADPRAKVYGEPDPELTYQVTEGSLVPGDAFSGSLAREEGEDVGSYAIQQGSLALTPNYAPTFVENTLTITVRPITVTADPQTKVYGEPDPELTYQVTVGSLAFSDTFSGSLTRQTGEDLGSYAILQGSLSLSSNYDLAFVGNVLNITLRQVTVTADTLSKVYGKPDPKLTFQITSGALLPGDAFTGTLHRNPGKDVGSYAILQGSLALPAYYSLNFVPGTMNITARPVTVTADYQTKTIGQPDPALTYQVTSGALAYNDAFTGMLTRQPGEAMGSYAILQGTLALSANYELTYVGNNLTIMGARIWLPVIMSNK